MNPTLVTIAVCGNADPTLKSWLTMRVSRRDDQHIHFQVDVAAALKSDSVSFMHAVSENEAKVLKADIVGGILLARKMIGRIGFTAEVLSLGGCQGDERRISALPTMGFGVAAHLAVLQGLHIEDLQAKPRGGYGWRLETMTERPDEGGSASG